MGVLHPTRFGMKVLQVCTGRARPLHTPGGTVLSAIAKQAVSGRVAVGPLGLEGDEQAHLSVHGGLSKAVYAYPAEHLAFWQTVRAKARVAGWGQALSPGALGENLLLQGLLESDLWVGDRLIVGAGSMVGGCVLAVTEPRHPCFKFAAAIGFAQATQLMWRSGFCGSYLAVLEPGFVQAGDGITLQPGPREVSIRELFKSRAPRT